MFAAVEGVKQDLKEMKSERDNSIMYSLLYTINNKLNELSLIKGAKEVV